MQSKSDNDCSNKIKQNQCNNNRNKAKKKKIAREEKEEKRKSGRTKKSRFHPG